MSLIAYFDESGTHTGGPNAAKVFVLCGYIAPKDVWEKQFAPRWSDMLQSYELPDKPDPRYFHATELEDGGYPYNRLTARQQESLKTDAVKIATSCGIIGIGGGVEIEPYQRLMAPYVQRGLTFKDPYIFLFSDVLLEAIDQSVKFLGESPDEKIAFFFEENPPWELRAHKMFSLMKQDEEWPRRNRLGTVAFEEKKANHTLQVADNLAYETFRLLNDRTKVRRPAMNLFMDSWPQNEGRLYDERGLFRFIEVCKKDGKF